MPCAPLPLPLPAHSRWYCWDGLYSLQSLQSGAAGARLVASYQYPNPE
jgi:hypothetical protein